VDEFSAPTGHSSIIVPDCLVDESAAQHPRPTFLAPTACQRATALAILAAQGTAAIHPSRVMVEDPALPMIDGDMTGKRKTIPLTSVSLPGAEHGVG
jgi:hypothetical protein